MTERSQLLAWTALGVAGVLCLIAAAYMFGGATWALIVAGVAMVVLAVDGRRP